jgi:hypothetical protein
MKMKNIKASIGFILLISLYSLTQNYYINIQGRLFNSAKTPLNGRFDLTIKIYDAQTGGTSLWGPKTFTVTVNNGLYSFELGPFTESEIATVFTGDKRYMEIHIDNNPDGAEDATSETLTPRIPINASALSLNSILLGGKNKSFFIDTSNSTQTKIGSLIIGETLEIQNNSGAEANLKLTGNEPAIVWQNSDGKVRIVKSGQSFIIEEWNNNTWEPKYKIEAGKHTIYGELIVVANNGTYEFK